MASTEPQTGTLTTFSTSLPARFPDGQKGTMDFSSQTSTASHTFPMAADGSMTR